MGANVSDKLYIPAKIKVGFQNRGDTYTKRLAYVTYFGPDGKLRKEKSWEGWRDKKIKPEEFDNSPHVGFVLNKDVKRCSEWFGSGRNMIRIYDDRGFEFEITTGNLLFILMTTDCLKRGLEGEFVYAWQGTELVLLPVNCDEYRNSAKHTELQHSKVSAKQLTPGCSYKTRKGQDFIYLGRFVWLDGKYSYRNGEDGGLKIGAQKKHVFIDDKQEVCVIDPGSLAAQNTDIPVSNFAELVDVFTKSPRASKAVSLEAKPTKKDDLFCTLDPTTGKYYEWQRYSDYYWDRNNRVDQISYRKTHLVYMDAKGTLHRSHVQDSARNGYDWYRRERRPATPPPPVDQRVVLHVVLENGEKLPVDKYIQSVYGRYYY